MRRHPHLGRKLQLLYSLRLNPSIKSHADLAEVLGISRQAVGKWARGTETSQGDAIPLTQVEHVAAIFAISQHWLALEYGDFEARLYEKLEAESRLDSKKPEQISVSLMPNTPAKIFGRKSELKALDAEWNDKQTNVLQLIAFGGMGKSSLVNAWLSRLDQKGYCGARRVYAWSFYWQAASSEVRSSGDYFIEHALGWFGDANPVEGSPWEKAIRLAHLIRSKRTLLLLDGLEPMQYPPGPRHGLIENPAVALLLKELATENNGMCLITSRLPVADLTSFEGGRVKLFELERLSVKSGTKMLKALGLQGAYTEYAQAVQEYSGHPLSLSLLGGYLNVVHKGRVADYRKIRSLLDEQDKSTQARNLMRNYLDWFNGTPERALLFMVGLFDRAVCVNAIADIARQTPDIEHLTQDLCVLTDLQYSYALDRLKQANLVTESPAGSSSLVDCHPLVRDFLSEYLKTEHPSVWKQGHAILYDHLKSLAKENPASIADLEPLFRAVIHGTQAELYESAFELYFQKIKKGYIMLPVGSHHADQHCIHSFFDPLNRLPVPALSDGAKFYLLSSAAANLMSLGKVEDALNPCLQSLDWFVRHEKWLDAAKTAGPFLSMLIAVGKLEEALQLLAELDDCVGRTGNVVIKAISQSFKAHAFHLMGEDEQAGTLFEKAEKVLTRDDPGSQVSFPTVSSYYCKYLLETGQPELSLSRSLKTLAWRSRGAWQVAIDTTSLLASDLQVLGLAFLEVGDKTSARTYLDQQLELLRDADEWLYLPSGLNARACLGIELADFESARRDLEDALEISRRTGAKFGEWETYLNFAKLCFQVNDLTKAWYFLEQMDGIGGMDLYKFRDREIARLRSRLDGSGIPGAAASQQLRSVVSDQNE